MIIEIRYLKTHADNSNNKKKKKTAIFLLSLFHNSLVIGWYDEIMPIDRDVELEFDVR